MTRRAWIVVTCVAIFLGIVAALALDMRPYGKPPAQRVVSGPGEAAKTPPPVPTLYCDFYNFMHNATVVSFYFSVDLADPVAPNVAELFIIDPDGTKTEFGADGSPSPRWTYHVEEGTPTITSPDTAAEIVLYGFKPRTGGAFWVEAGIRSNDYRNLEGKCRQANFGDAAKAAAPKTKIPG